MLVGRRGEGGVAGVDRRAAGEQGHGLGRPAVVPQGAELRVAGEGPGQPATAVLDQVVAAGDGTGSDVGDITARGAAGHDGVVQCRRAAVVDAAAGWRVAELPDRVELVSVTIADRVVAEPR